MNILYCGDEKMTQGLLLSILSLLDHTKHHLQIYVLTATISNAKQTFYPVSDQAIAFFDQLVKQQNPANNVVKFDITKLMAAQPPTANLETNFTPNCMLRLYADQLPAIPDRVLYLDTDVLCRHSFTSFYEQDLTDVEVVGVLDHYGKWFFHQNWRQFDYLNSGVMLLNLALIRQDGLFARCRQRCQTTWMFMPDQSALNQLSERKRIAPDKFNEQHQLQPETVFQHFTTSFRFFPWFQVVTIKPWEIERVHRELELHDYDKLYQQYQQLNQAFQEEVNDSTTENDSDLLRDR